MIGEVLEGYAAVGDDWITRSEAISCETLFAPVADLLPQRPSRIADIGAGTGRDAAWLAASGHRVVAVEPVARLRLAGEGLHKARAITWLDDRLPELERLANHGPFDLILLVGVWQHLDDDERRIAMSRLAQLLAPGGMTIMSLRHGPGAPGRPVVQVSVADTIAQAGEAGLGGARQAATGSMQAWNRAAGVTWTWLALARPSHPGEPCQVSENSSSMNNGMA